MQNPHQVLLFPQKTFLFGKISHLTAHLRPTSYPQVHIHSAYIPTRTVSVAPRSFTTPCLRWPQISAGGTSSPQPAAQQEQENDVDNCGDATWTPTCSTRAPPGRAACGDWREPPFPHRGSSPVCCSGCEAASVM